MPGDELWFDGPDAELGDDEFPEEDESEPDDDVTDTSPCPKCGAEVYEDAVRCPVCGSYVTWSTAGVWSGRPRWWITLGLLGVLTAILVLLGLIPW